MLSENERYERARGIRALVLDVDGVLTDGSILIDAGGAEAKRFDVRDGLGIRCWLRAGHRIGVISGRDSRAVEHRCRELGIESLIQGSPVKVPAFERLLAQWGLGAGQVCALGDDLPDLPLLLASGIGAAVADAHPAILSRCDWVCRYPGGRGAVRELIEEILEAQEIWAGIVAEFAGPAGT